MTPPEDPEPDASMLSEVDAAVLVDLLEHGDNTPRNVSDNVEASRQYVSDRLGELEGRGLVESKGAGVYTLTREGLRTAQIVRRSQQDD